MNLEIISDDVYEDKNTGKLYRHAYVPINFSLECAKPLHEFYSYPKIVYDYNFRSSIHLIPQDRKDWKIDDYHAIEAKGKSHDQKIVIMSDQRLIENISILIHPLEQGVLKAASALNEDPDTIELGCLYEEIEDGPHYFKLRIDCPKEEFFFLYNMLINRMAFPENFALEIWLKAFVVDESNEESDEDNIYYIEDIYAPRQVLLKALKINGL